MVALFMMSVKLATLGLLEINVVSRNGYDAITLSMASPKKIIMLTK